MHSSLAAARAARDLVGIRGCNPPGRSARGQRRFPRQATTQEIHVSHEHAVPSAASEPSVALEHLNLLQVARRRKWLILLGSVVGLSLAALYTKLAGPWYEST